MRILLVEDHELNRELARDLLMLAGHDVITAVDGASFRAELRGSIQIVLLDILLPDTDGVTLVKALRKGPFANLRVVALTAQARSSEVNEFLAAGFDGILTKPIDTRTFVADVERMAFTPRSAS